MKRDLTNQKFGRLTALRPTVRRSRGSVVWECLCDCGNTCEVATNFLTAGKVKSCGCLRAGRPSGDIAGQRFGMLTAIEPVTSRISTASGSSAAVEPRGHPTARQAADSLWRCICDCGNEREVTFHELRSGAVTNCGCKPEQGIHPKPRAKNLAGRRFGRLVVVEPIGRKNGYVLWKCRCDCGNATDATTNQLTSGHVRSCGCLRREKPRVDIAGQRFGDLTAVEPTDGRERGSIVWKCRCSCGRETEMSSARLKHLKHPICGHH